MQPLRALRQGRDVPGRGTPGLRIVRLYDVVRSAHLERALEHPNVTILYSRHRYDFNQDLADSSSARAAGAVAVFRYLVSRRIEVIEINEPLAYPNLARLAAAFAAARFLSLSGRRPRIVTYAIENLDSRSVIRTLPPRARLTRTIGLWAAPFVWRRLDRIAYGTEQAAALYGTVFGSVRRGPVERTILHLPVAAAELPAAAPPTVVFLGDLSPRKGFDRVLDAWPEVNSRVPGATLRILGKGSDEHGALAAAGRDPSITVLIDPSRTAIFEELGTAKVLVLPSRRGPMWREQVGLPIVEGLGSGCLIVTTSESGLAPWLERNGHVVLPEDVSTHGLASGVITALASPQTKSDVVASLPHRDGRQSADDWLTGGPIRTEEKARRRSMKRREPGAA